MVSNFRNLTFQQKNTIVSQEDINSSYQNRSMSKPGSQLDFNPSADKSEDLRNSSAFRSRSTGFGSNAWANQKKMKNKQARSTV